MWLFWFIFAKKKKKERKKHLAKFSHCCRLNIREPRSTLGKIEKNTNINALLSHTPNIQISSSKAFLNFPRCFNFTGSRVSFVLNQLSEWVTFTEAAGTCQNVSFCPWLFFPRSFTVRNINWNRSRRVRASCRTRYFNLMTVYLSFFSFSFFSNNF